MAGFGPPSSFCPCTLQGLVFFLRCHFTHFHRHPVFFLFKKELEMLGTRLRGAHGDQQSGRCWEPFSIRHFWGIGSWP